MKVHAISILSLAAILCGCLQEESREEVLISPLFDVCMEVPASSTYVLDDGPPVDFDEGVLSVGADGLSVYVGHNPDFDKKSRQVVPSDEGGFVLVGKQNTEDGYKALFAQRRGPHEVMYVMFVGGEIYADSLLRDIALKTCGS